jgi:hypothetical protein
MMPNAVWTQLLNGANTKAPLIAALAFVAGYWVGNSDWKRDRHYDESRRSFTHREHERHHEKGHER